jgi:hypothetical protein
MPPQLSKRLGPRARRLVQSSPPQEVISALVELSPTADQQTLQDEINRLGGRVRSWLTELRACTAEVPASRLTDLADLEGVSYVEAGERFSL